MSLTIVKVSVAISLSGSSATSRRAKKPKPARLASGSWPVAGLFSPEVRDGAGTRTRRSFLPGLCPCAIRARCPRFPGAVPARPGPAETMAKERAATPDVQPPWAPRCGRAVSSFRALIDPSAHPTDLFGGQRLAPLGTARTARTALRAIAAGSALGGHRLPLVETRDGDDERSLLALLGDHDLAVLAPPSAPRPTNRAGGRPSACSRRGSRCRRPRTRVGCPSRRSGLSGRKEEAACSGRHLRTRSRATRWLRRGTGDRCVSWDEVR